MKKYLIIQLARFGDIIQTKRLILALQQQGEVSLLIDSTLESIAKLVYPTINIIGLHVLSANPITILTENKKIFEFLQQNDFDEVYPLNHSSFCQCITNLFPQEILHGYTKHATQMRQSNWVRMAFRWLSNRKITPINLVDFWGLFTQNPYPAHLVNPKALGKGHGLGVVLAGQNARRSLPPKIYAKIICACFGRLQKYHTLHDKKIYLLGTEKEQKFANELLIYLPQHIKDITENLTGKTSFLDLQEIIKNLELVLSPDTGTAHFSAHLGIPVEGFYLSSANVFETGPYGDGHKIWQAYFPCTPCKEMEKCSQIIDNETACSQAFTQAEFLFHLTEPETTKENLSKKPLKNIIPYTSCFLQEEDSLFQTWTSLIYNPFDIQREKIRNYLENYCLAYTTINTCVNCHTLEENTLYQDIDWIFPQQNP